MRFDDPFSSEWAPHEIGEEGGRVVFRMRVDTLKVPAVMLKAYTVAGERERLRAAGREKLTRPEKDQVKSDVRKELSRRSLAKMVSWRVTATVDTFIISYFVTGSFAWAGSIAGLEVLTKMGLYYLHERAWALVQWGGL